MTAEPRGCVFDLACHPIGANSSLLSNAQGIACHKIVRVEPAIWPVQPSTLGGTVVDTRPDHSEIWSQELLAAVGRVLASIQGRCCDSSVGPGLEGCL